jgi:hypothetical protein
VLAKCVPASYKRWQNDEPVTLQYFLYVQSLPTDAPLPPMYVAAQYPTFEDQDDAIMEKEQTAERPGSSLDTDTHHNRKLQERLAQFKVRSVAGLPRDSKLNAHSPSHAPRALIRRICASDKLLYGVYCTLTCCMVCTLTCCMVCTLTCCMVCTITSQYTTHTVQHTPSLSYAKRHTLP